MSRRVQLPRSPPVLGCFQQIKKTFYLEKSKNASCYISRWVRVDEGLISRIRSFEYFHRNHLYLLRQVGKASDFDSDIRWFESIRGCQQFNTSVTQWTRVLRYERRSRVFESLRRCQCWYNTVVVYFLGKEEVAGSSPAISTKQYAPVAEWPNAFVCKTKKPWVQISPGVPDIHCRLGARDGAQPEEAVRFRSIG